MVEDSTIDTPYSSLTSNGIETNNTIVADDDDPDDSDKPEDVNEVSCLPNTLLIYVRELKR